MSHPPYDLAPLFAVAGIGALVAALPIGFFLLRHRAAAPSARLRALALLALFLTADLVLLGAFTRLSDSGLGCPDWPGCYGHASPIGAAARIDAAETAMPTGAVTTGKAWIEMTHRYAATAIGVLVLALAALAFVEWRRGRVATSPAWAVATLIWIVAQGAFGALTVTMRLYPAIVTLHLLGGMALLALLAAQAESYGPRSLAVGRPMRATIVAFAALVVLQLALGGWVSSNYAVLACRDFPTCQGSWWPPADFEAGFELQRRLGALGDGSMVPFPALTAIHMAHRVGAAFVVAASLALAFALAGRGPEARRFAIALVAVAAWQVASGLGNVLLGWPLAAALAHTAGAAALVVVVTVLLARVLRERATGRMPARLSPQAAEAAALPARRKLAS